MTVFLVGAGPGDPALLTVRAAQLLERAEAVVVDRLVDPRVLHLVAPSALLVDVGKRSGDGSDASQHEINNRLIELGRSFNVVVRLKGGDPYLLGRGGEEALALEAAGVPCEVVPGVSSALAVPAYAGVPVTHRGVSSGVVVVSGHDAGDPACMVDWQGVARSGCTVVVLMGASTRREVARRLLDGGRSPATPVLIVEAGTTPQQRSSRTTLEVLAQDVGITITSPATIVVGEVAALQLASYDQRPLFGWKVLVTRAAEQAPPLETMLGELGAQAIRLPLIEIADPSDCGTSLRSAAARIGEYEWIVFSSVHGVERLFEEIVDARQLGSCRIAAIGPSTAAALAARGVVADLVPSDYVAESLAGEFPSPELRSEVDTAHGGRQRPSRVLIARAQRARDVVPDALRARGYEVDVVEAYTTQMRRPSAEELVAIDDAHAVTFTSSSTVRAFVAAAGRHRVPPLVAVIGPATAQTARELGLDVHVEAEPHTVEGLVNALVGFVARHGMPQGRDR